jgi:hypothetical protein
LKTKIIDWDSANVQLDIDSTVLIVFRMITMDCDEGAALFEQHRNHCVIDNRLIRAVQCEDSHNVNKLLCEKDCARIVETAICVFKAAFDVVFSHCPSSQQFFKDSILIVLYRLANHISNILQTAPQRSYKH